MSTLDRRAGINLPGVEREEAGETAEAYVHALLSQGVDFLFLNPGTDTFPIQEALSKLESDDRPAPRTVLCLFEIVALAAAHGYYAATGRPQAVLVHVDVGTQNLGSMLHDAQRGRAAVVIAAGRAPYTSDPNLRGSRSSYIHWLQEQMDQHGIVRNYVKWDYELRRPDQIGEVVSRAYQVAASDPPGPVYLTLPRENLMENAGSFDIYRPEKFPPVRLGDGGHDLLDRAATMLLEAKNPVVATANSGRNEAGYNALVRLVETLALPVVEWRSRANFPSDHPLHQGFDIGPLLRDADLILSLDHDFPYIPTQVQPNPDARMIQIDVDPVKEEIPLWSFPVDLPIRANSAQALDTLASIVEKRLTDKQRSDIQGRHAQLSRRHQELRSAWDDGAREHGARDQITPQWLSYCLGDLVREQPNCLLVDETVTNNEMLWKYVPTLGPGTWFGSGGSGLGWGLGAALGVKLAHPDRPVLSLVGDGSFVFGAPLAALWAMQTNHAPVMVVIFNNTCYYATKRPLMNAYPEGYSVRHDHWVGIDLMPAPNYAMLAQSVGGYGEQVDDPSDVPDALRRGMAQIAAGKTVVLDVRMEHP
jgi:acetolactate synthase I/II/III large subunit